LYDDEFLSMVQKTDFILELAVLTIVLCGFCDFFNERGSLFILKKNPSLCAHIPSELRSNFQKLFLKGDSDKIPIC